MTLQTIYHPVTGEPLEVSHLNAHDMVQHNGWLKKKPLVLKDGTVHVASDVVIPDADDVEPESPKAFDEHDNAEPTDEPEPGAQPGTLEAMSKQTLISFMKQRGMTPDGRQSHAKLLSEAKARLELDND